MALPPEEIEPLHDADTVVARLRKWPGFRPFATWAIEDPEVYSYETEQTEVRLRLVARPQHVNLGLAAAIELDRDFQLDPRTGHLAHAEHAANLLEDIHARLTALVGQAVSDEPLRAWLLEHPGAIARYEDLGGPDRLAFRTAPTDENPCIPRFFPEIT